MVPGMAVIPISNVSAFTYVADFTEWNTGQNNPAMVLTVAFWATGMVTFVGTELYLWDQYKVHRVHQLLSVLVSQL